jgi:hypothetical protein
MCGLRWSAVDLDVGEITVHDNRVVRAARAWAAAHDRAASAYEAARDTSISLGTDGFEL